MSKTDAQLNRNRRSVAAPRMAVILTGSSPAVIRGGMGTAVAGYRQALIGRGLFGGFVPTFEAGSFRGKWWPWLRAIPAVCYRIRRLKKEGKGVVVYGHAGPRMSMVRESLILSWAWLCGARTMLQLHAPHIDRYLDKRYVRFLMRVAFLPVNRVTVLSAWWQERLSRGGFHGTVVIPNPLSRDLETVANQTKEQAASRDSRDQPKKELIILAMAKLLRGKRVHIAVEALKYLPDRFVLRVAGDGPELESLKALAAKLGVSERVRFLGWVSGQGKAQQLEEADIFCAPSNADAFSMSMIEALSHGLPIVTVRSKAMADLVKDGETGFVVAVDDTQAVAEAIKRLDDASLRACMGTAAAGWVTDHLSGSVVGKRIEEVVSELAGSAG